MAVNRKQVVQVALSLLDETGLEGLTLKRIADELGVRTPTLYWHVSSKQALLDEMATAMVREFAWPATPAGDWREWLTAVAGALRGTLLRYRDGARVLSGRHLTDDSALTMLEVPLRTLADAGFATDEAARAWGILYAYVVGFTIEEQAVHPASGDRDPRYAPETRAERIDPESHPLTRKAGTVLLGDFDRRFEHGVRVLVTGLDVVRGGAEG
ncbi:TetR/AcrR family transcriptional regulator C-terminal domain-containing protein [Streptomyces sp. V2I9]|uniref:TetR/AcrR family transcriptional regulator C-terminal domain-containing protein n=1 Tax=Streptomyces sp. V2I9 TaxID=3042304 RepID=UPI0027861DCF|nr:TetR/AcrR family transcriptional regulator C-terminal domain-containing protein [Streptomyces sp. V2I9]MDQ0985301.1 TetR/AcrR family tetracycline transcriptional repressor [Streptomyces sp. V2I9]